VTFPLALIPTLPLTGLSEDEQAVFGTLLRKLGDDEATLELRDAYYNGEQAMTNLGISLPPELQGLHTVMGWPRLAVDALHERLDVEGFRFPSADDADEGLWEIWQANNLDEESPLAHLDALVFGRAYVLVGTSSEGDIPLVTVESPLNLAGDWDGRLRRLGSVLQLFPLGGEQGAALYLPDQTVTLRRDRSARWEVVDRDQHRLGVVPVLRMANRQRAHDRSGWSEITPEVMSITDAGCRTLVGMEVAREFYAAPQRYILGASEEAFQDAAGNKKTAWETYVGRVLALERDDEGNVPQVGQFTPYNPAVYGEIINTYAEVMASLTGLPPSYLGRSTDNPASADAIRMSTDRLVKRVQRRQRSFEGAWEGAMRLAARFRGQSLSDDARMIETIWRNPEIPTPAATTDAVVKQIQAGYLPAISDVAGEKLGYSPLQRRRIDAERRRAEGGDALSALLAQAQGGLNGEPAGQPASG
jgi:hypothetical protein